MKKRLLLSSLVLVSGVLFCAGDEDALSSGLPVAVSDTDSVVGDADTVQKESLFHPKSAAMAVLLLGGYAYKKQGFDFVGNWKAMTCIALGAGAAGFVPVDSARNLLSSYVPQRFFSTPAEEVQAPNSEEMTLLGHSEEQDEE